MSTGRQLACVELIYGFLHVTLEEDKVWCTEDANPVNGKGWKIIEDSGSGMMNLDVRATLPLQFLVLKL